MSKMRKVRFEWDMVISRNDIYPSLCGVSPTFISMVVLSHHASHNIITAFSARENWDFSLDNCSLFAVVVFDDVFL
jgi:hypothetical protein